MVITPSTLPTPTLAPVRGGPVACLSGPVGATDGPYEDFQTYEIQNCIIGKTIFVFCYYYCFWLFHRICWVLWNMEQGLRPYSNISFVIFGAVNIFTKSGHFHPFFYHRDTFQNTRQILSDLKHILFLHISEFWISKISETLENIDTETW